MLKAFTKIFIKDRVLATFQDNVATFLNQLTSPILTGVIVKNISVSTGNNIINHTLGRVPEGYIIVSASADIRLFNTGSETTPNATINLTSNANGIVSIYFF